MLKFLGILLIIAFLLIGMPHLLQALSNTSINPIKVKP